MLQSLSSRAKVSLEKLKNEDNLDHDTASLVKNYNNLPDDFKAALQKSRLFREAFISQNNDAVSKLSQFLGAKDKKKDSRKVFNDLVKKVCEESGEKYLGAGIPRDTSEQVFLKSIGPDGEIDINKLNSGVLQQVRSEANSRISKKSGFDIRKLIDLADKCTKLLGSEKLEEPNASTIFEKAKTVLEGLDSFKQYPDNYVSSVNLDKLEEEVDPIYLETFPKKTSRQDQLSGLAKKAYKWIGGSKDKDGSKNNSSSKDHDHDNDPSARPGRN